MSVAENPYATPCSRLSWMPNREPVFLVVAPRKFLVMVMLTLGGYFAYWLYRQWVLYQQASDKRLWPWVRVMFPACYFCSLILSVMRELEQGESAYHWWPRCLAVVIFLGGCLPFTVLWLLSPFAALAVVACIAVLQVALALQLQCAINHMERDPEGEGNALLTRANWLWMGVGLLGWGLLVTGGIWGAG